jgi:nucleotide-binding universal stress UspA family protein
MSIFPTRILLATDGSEEAELAATRAVDIAEKTGSELHVVHVGVVPSFLVSYPGTLGYERRLYEQIEEESRQRLRELSWRVKLAGGTVAGTHLRMGEVALEIVALAEELGVGLIVMGSSWLGGIGAGSHIVSTIARMVGHKDRAFLRTARYTTLITMILSPILLIMDLGRPERFYNMLRIVKWRSPMSMGPGL